MRDRISIITPSYRPGSWLRLCIASVADQGMDVEHIVQDACSDDGTQEWLAKDSRVQAFIEKDAGMYDAVNRGFGRANGDILAYLNCDEQYLPGALARVAECFARHPTADAVLGDCIVVDPTGGYICERRSLAPQLCHTWVGTSLSFLTAGLFLRRRVVTDHGLKFDQKFRDLGDQDWTLRAIRAGLRFVPLGEFTSTFADTGQNMNLLPNARREAREMFASAPAWMRATAPWWVAHYRLRRLAAGAYMCRPHDYAIYTDLSPTVRQTIEVPNPTYRWIRSPEERSRRAGAAAR